MERRGRDPREGEGAVRAFIGAHPIVEIILWIGKLAGIERRLCVRHFSRCSRRGSRNGSLSNPRSRGEEEEKKKKWSRSMVRARVIDRRRIYEFQEFSSVQQGWEGERERERERVGIYMYRRIWQRLSLIYTIRLVSAAWLLDNEIRVVFRGISNAKWLARCPRSNKECLAKNWNRVIYTRVTKISFCNNRVVRIAEIFCEFIASVV